MWDAKYLRWLDWRLIAVVCCLMAASLLVISSYSIEVGEHVAPFVTPLVRSQLQWFIVGWGVFVLAAGFDYNKLREWAVALYVVGCMALTGLFFTTPIQGVQRWYRLSFCNFQPSEYAKLAVVVALSWWLERYWGSGGLGVAFGAAALVLLPFLLILRQPDLGTALVLLPVGLAIGWFGGLHRGSIRMGVTAGIMALFAVGLVFSGIVSHETMRPFALKFFKEYQYERLNPDTHHQKAAADAIAVGGPAGVGWRSSEFGRSGGLPAPYTDSVFAALGEEFGLCGMVVVLVLYYALVYCAFQVVAVARELFGRLLAAGIAVYIGMHVVVNIGMMCGLLPITGVPLVLMSYGGSSVVATMLALGILQSIYSRRFVF